MKKFDNCSVKAANITVRMKDNKNTYRIYGYAFNEVHDDVECVVLQPSDMRHSPVFYAPADSVASVDVMF